MLALIRGHRHFFLGGLAAALALRLLFFFWVPELTDDSRVYVDLATNWMQNGVYGQTQTVPPVSPQETATTKIVPIDSRLPGYPAFLAVIFWLFGVGNIKAVLQVQILVDLATCLTIADLARRLVSDNAARVAFVLAGLCPFLANYTAAVLTETLEVFFTAIAFDCAAAALNRMRDGRLTGLVDPTSGALWAGMGAAIGGCILLRPDGGVVLAALVLYLLYLAATSPKRLRKESNWEQRAPSVAKAGAKNVSVIDISGRAMPAASMLVAPVLVAVFALAPLAPWAIRNFRTLHHFQPLAPRYANETDELVPRGFNRWVKTWIVDYVSVEEIYWNIPGDKIDAGKLPSRAFDDAAQRETTLAVITDYNESQDMTPELDARFGELAAARVRTHPMRYYVNLPLLRVADMWLRPRTEILPPDVRWWEFNDDVKHSLVAVGFGLLNLAYVGTAAWTLIWRRQEIRWVGLLVCFLLLRSALLITLENPEPRYTLECYPVVIVLAAACILRRTADPSLRSR